VNAARIAEKAHESWCAWLRAQGWTCGPEFDADAKIQPMLVPFDELPDLYRAQMIRAATKDGEAAFIDMSSELGPRGVS